MGLAASQARLLTITARLADNELRSQTINNAKMRLATQSAQASNEYVSALNNAQLMFNNTAENGIAQSQALTFNALTQYSQYNNQYGLVNSAGQILVSEADAKMFQDNSNNLEGFLKAHGLEWDTTYFDDEELMKNRLRSFYSGDYAQIGNLLGNQSSLKEMYLKSISQEASIEKLNYDIFAHNLYTQYSDLYTNSVPIFRGMMFGEAPRDEDNVAKTISNSFSNNTSLLSHLKNGSNPVTINGSSFNPAYNFNNIKQYLSESGERKVSTFLNSLRDVKNPETGVIHTVYSVSENDNVSISKNEVPNSLSYYESASATEAKTHNSTKTTYSMDGITVTVEEVPTAYWDSPSNTKPKNSWTWKTTVQVNSGKWYYDGESPATPHDGSYTKVMPGTVDINTILPKISKQVSETDSDGSVDTYYVTYAPAGDNKYCRLEIPSSGTRQEQYELFVREYFSLIMSEGYFDPTKMNPQGSTNSGLGAFVNAYNDYKNLYGFVPAQNYLASFDNLILDGQYTGATSSFYNVLNVYLTEKMVDVLGEPKYAWVDKSANPTDNPDNKAQWLTNLFNRMQKGYKVLENGLASSTQWLEHAFESGLVTMEQVDMSYNWINMDYKTCSNIYEQTDNSAIVAKAEAKYNRAMNDIKQKDSLFDLQLKNIDTEHSALQTEYDVIKGVMSKNIERTMKFDQSA